MRKRSEWWGKRGAVNSWKCIVAHYRERATLVKLATRRQRTHNGAAPDTARVPAPRVELGRMPVPPQPRSLPLSYEHHAVYA
jgi:hypothetical protein